VFQMLDPIADTKRSRGFTFILLLLLILCKTSEKKVTDRNTAKKYQVS
jgi:hypothetical protein